jgi:thiamine pyrophosphate-dependent acetolactate synthase large subunit-like protein
MALTAADVLIETVQDWGVEVVFGLPGDGINGIMEALRKRRDEVRFFQVRHEEAAALMACGYAPRSPEQAAKFAKSLLRGEPNSPKIALTVLGDRIRELV